MTSLICFYREKERYGEIFEKVGVREERVINFGWFKKERFEWAKIDDWAWGLTRGKKSIGKIEG